MSYDDWNPLILIGDVQLFEQEGGFTAPTIWVCGRNLDADGMEIPNCALDRALYQWAHGELPNADRGGSVDMDKETLGFLRITVERIE